jgi:hypothetical protein
MINLKQSSYSLSTSMNKLRKITYIFSNNSFQLISTSGEEEDQSVTLKVPVRFGANSLLNF